MFTQCLTFFTVQIFHKIITCGHQRLHPLFDCLLTIIVNSEYPSWALPPAGGAADTEPLSSCSFSLPEEPLHGGGQQAAAPAGGLLLPLVPAVWSSEPQPGVLPAGGLQQHHPVSVWWWGPNVTGVAGFQTPPPPPNWGSAFSSAGNSNLVYSIIRKRNVFHQLANLPTDAASIQKALQRRKKSGISNMSSADESMEGSRPAAPAEPGTLKASLEATPGGRSEDLRLPKELRQI